jgi:hypothetical protein
MRSRQKRFRASADRARSSGNVDPEGIPFIFCFISFIHTNFEQEGTEKTEKMGGKAVAEFARIRICTAEVNLEYLTIELNRQERQVRQRIFDISWRPSRAWRLILLDALSEYARVRNRNRARFASVPSVSSCSYSNFSSLESPKIASMPMRTQLGGGEAAVAWRRRSPYNGPPTFDLGLRKSTE